VKTGGIPIGYSDPIEDEIFIKVSFSSYADLQQAQQLLSTIKCVVNVGHPEKNNHRVPVEGCHYPTSERLSEREKEMLLLLAKGFSYSESASFLGCSISTIQTHVKRTYRKLGVNSRSEAVYEALQLGLIDI